MMFGAWGNTDHDDSIRIIHRSLDAGINFVDTADVYSAGESEEIVGKALKDRRDDVLLATKLYMPMGDDPNRRGGSRRWIVRAVEDSLRRLGTDWIDLYQVHRPDLQTDVLSVAVADTSRCEAGWVSRRLDQLAWRSTAPHPGRRRTAADGYPLRAAHRPRGSGCAAAAPPSTRRPPLPPSLSPQGLRRATESPLRRRDPAKRAREDSNL
jgi:hypothetical protein